MWKWLKRRGKERVSILYFANAVNFSLLFVVLLLYIILFSFLCHPEDKTIWFYLYLIKFCFLECSFILALNMPIFLALNAIIYFMPEIIFRAVAKMVGILVKPKRKTLVQYVNFVGAYSYIPLLFFPLIESVVWKLIELTNTVIIGSGYQYIVMFGLVLFVYMRINLLPIILLAFLWTQITAYAKYK